MLGMEARAATLRRAGTQSPRESVAGLRVPAGRDGKHMGLGINSFRLQPSCPLVT